MINSYSMKEMSVLLNIPLTGKWGGIYAYFEKTSYRTILKKLQEKLNPQIIDFKVQKFNKRWLITIREGELR